VYVTMAALEAHPEEQVELEWSETSMTLIVKGLEGKVGGWEGGGSVCLVLTHLIWAGDGAAV
jgi:hypothetical protein